MERPSIVPKITLAPEDRVRLIEVFKVAADAAPPPSHRAKHALFPRRRLAAAALVAAGIAAAIGLGGRGGEAAQPGPAAANVAVVLKPVWIDITQPLQFYSLPARELDRKPQHYTARRHSTGEGRQDALVFGALDGHALYVRLNLYRVGREDAPVAAFFVDLARRAAEDGAAIARSGQPAPLATRFGDFEAADALLSGPQGQHACIGYRLQNPAQPLRISGYACGTVASPLDRGTLACILDRLDLVSAGEDAGLRRFFVEAELRRSAGCRPGHPASAAAKPSWLTPTATLPALHGTQATAAMSGKVPEKPLRAVPLVMR